MKLFRGLGFGRQLDLSKATETLVLASGENASSAYLVEPHLARSKTDCLFVDTNRTDARTLDWARFNRIVIVRYISRSLLRRLREFRDAGGEIVYFMDDDLMDPAALTTLPKAYARKIRKLSAAHRRFLESVCTDYWVSTPYLAEKYAAWSARVIVPKASPELLARSSRITVCYHGTSSHQLELHWLAGVVTELQSTTDNLHFEIFGDSAVNRMYRVIPRVAVLHPMSWSNYVEFSSSVTREIGLAPLLPSEFNAARGPTKFFDFVRMGAVGIYSNTAPYQDFVRNGVDGILLPNDPAKWIATIKELAAYPPMLEP